MLDKKEEKFGPCTQDRVSFMSGPFLSQFAQGPLLSGIECPASWKPLYSLAAGQLVTTCSVVLFGRISLALDERQYLLFKQLVSIVYKWLSVQGPCFLPYRVGLAASSRHWSPLCPRHWQLALARKGSIG